jgi:protocatechuate 3,4-dioxygenase beta subunit
MIARRGLLTVTFGLPLAARAQQQGLPLTPACDDGDPPTPRQTEGPYFSPGSPERADLLEPGLPGRPMELSGLVLGRDCRPVPAALVDLWHCDGGGRYDTEGYRCRGHQLTDAGGAFRFRTVMPGLYPGRTRHFHVKVQAPNGPLLTTQLYFPAEPANARDRIWRRELEMTVAPDGDRARFDFVVATA